MAKWQVSGGFRPVACQEDVMDLVLKEAGLTYSNGTTNGTGGEGNVEDKLAMLKGMREIAEHVKSTLGFDYVTPGGKFQPLLPLAYLGELAEVKFRKIDLLKLMAEREGVACRNVITGGEPLKGLKAAQGRAKRSYTLTWTMLTDLTIVLYLLGFSGSDVRALRKRRADSEGPCGPCGAANGETANLAPASKRKRFMVQVSAKTRAAGQLQSIFQPLGPEQPDVVVKDLMYACQKAGLTIMDMNDSANPCDWKSRYRNRYVPWQHGSARRAVEVSKKQGADIAIQRDDVIDELAKLAGVEAKVKDTRAATAAESAALEEITEAAMRGELDFFGSLKSRVALLKGREPWPWQGIVPWATGVPPFGLGGNELVWSDSGFSDSADCGTNIKHVQGDAPVGLGFKTAVISGGFLPVAREAAVQRELGLDYAFANTLEVDETTGLLTGQTSGPVVTPQRKRQLLATIANVEGCEIQQTIAVGDGANDIPMLHAAGLGIAFCAKPKVSQRGALQPAVQEVSRYRINQMDLSTVLWRLAPEGTMAGRRLKEQAHLRRITEGAPRNAGVVVLNEADVPIGFGVTARSTEECTSLGAEALVVYHQADVGEYLREEADLV
eukprot:Skav204132  [mRNA]  locus=scaffold2473:272454:321373:+ [translate_table: standard]